MNKDIYVFIEQREGKIQEVSLELLGKAAELAKEMAFSDFEVFGVLIGHDMKEQASTLFGYGANKVILCDHPSLYNYSTELYTDIFCAVVKQYKPDSVLVGASTLGRDMAPRIAARLDTGLTADATKIEVDKETENSTLLLVTRPAFGGNLFGTIICPTSHPQMATIRPKVFDVPAFNENAKGEIIEFPVDITAEAVIKSLKIEKMIRKGQDITEASVIVSAGRGAKDSLELIGELATELGGVMGSSRALVDAGYTKKDIQVGQTGKTVRPMIYIACGISGAVQHLAGMEKSDYIIAINTDPNAAIFKVANIGIVGDVKKVIPVLLDKIKANKQKSLYD